MPSLILKRWLTVDSEEGILRAATPLSRQHELFNNTELLGAELLGFALSSRSPSSERPTFPRLI
jgi:hypothetical protein